MKLILGPIIGAVTHKKAKVWIFWDPTHNEEVPKCLVFKDETCSEEVPKSPFQFQTVSSSVHEWEGIHGLIGLADISFPTRREKLYFKIKSSSIHDEENDQLYCIRPFPKSGAKIDTFSFALISDQGHPVCG